MYIKKQNFNELIARWMKSDPDLWSCLSKVEIKILHQRITKEYTFKKIAEEVDGTEELVHEIFLKAIEKIAKEVDHELAVELFILHKKIENPYQDKAFKPQSFYHIYLN